MTNPQVLSIRANFVFLGFLIAAFIQPSAMAPQQSELQVLEGNGHFTNNLYKVLAEKEGNVFFSPISAHAVLSMAFQGARGSTAEKFALALKVPEARATAEGYKEVITRLNNVQDVTLLIANKVFLKSGYQLKGDFNTAVTKNFLSEVQLLDFADSSNAANTINSWVEEKTRDKIKNLISADALDHLTRLVLVNAIYFKGDWLHKFNKDLTKTEEFYLNDEDSVDVQMMHIERNFRYADSPEFDAQILELPYKNENLSLVVILPKERNGIKKLEEKLAGVSLTEVTKGLSSVKVNVALPKFKVETTIDLKDSLTKLGLGEIFDEEKANFKGMLDSDEQLYVSKVIQKAFIEVNEEGAEAAAATGMMMKTRAFLIKPVERIEFKADHPFLYFILSFNQNNFSSNALFAGRVSALTS